MTRTIVALAVAGFVGHAVSASAQSTPTFSKDVAPILYKNCANCHRAGEIGPMPLLSYKDARPYARAIATRVQNGTMPPWHADDPTHSRFVNDRSLSAADKNLLVTWASGGAPEGNPKDLPAPPKFTEGWMMGKPDAVFTMQEEYPIPASGTLDYKFFEIPTNLTEDKWLQAFEVRPGARAAVHHVIAYVRPGDAGPSAAPAAPPAGGAPPAAAPAGGARPAPPFAFGPAMRRPADAPKPDRAPVENDRSAKRNPGAWLAGYAPGHSLRIYEPGTAIKIPKGAIITVQMHYTTNGTPTTDRTSIGLKFASEPPKTELVVVPLQNANFVLKAGAADTRVDAEVTVNTDVTLWSVLPHTHVRGKRWEVAAIYPDGHTEMILNVPKYDFNWQTDYIFKSPLTLPKGTKLKTSAWYDNSTANKSNPDPTKDVYWGDQTWEEMQFTAFTFSINQTPAATSPGR
jgi:hypothetical protein